MFTTRELILLRRFVTDMRYFRTPDEEEENLETKLNTLLYDHDNSG